MGLIELATDGRDDGTIRRAALELDGVVAIPRQQRELQRGRGHGIREGISRARAARAAERRCGEVFAVLVVSHDRRVARRTLVDAIANARGAVRIELAKENGEMIVPGRARLDEPPWKWTA